MCSILNLYDGNTGQQVTTLTVTLPPKRWTQLGVVLTHAAGVTQGYASVTRISGTNPFVAYAVINDGAQPYERSGDGAFVASAP
jgi:hypothetical protein